MQTQRVALPQERRVKTEPLQCLVSHHSRGLFYMARLQRLLVLILGTFYAAVGASALGSMSTIAASYGEDVIICAVEASRGQQVLCWGGSTTQLSTFSTSVLQPFLALSGGNGFMCGLKAQSLQPFCWRGNNTNQNLVPQNFQLTSYIELAAGENHVCGIRKTGTDCWRIDGGNMVKPNISSSLDSIVAGREFTCGIYSHTRKAVCWGERNLGSPSNDSFESLAAGRDHVCGIILGSRTVVCWGENGNEQANAPPGVSFASITAGFFHSCGILNASHEVVCWGGLSINTSAVPLGAQFVALTASENFTCGVRESNLLAVCWGNDLVDYQPPLQLFSPGICERRQCGVGEFAFNLSVIDSTLPNICFENSQRICLPCATSCPQRTFMSASCSAGLDRECTDCAMCKNSSCQVVCQIPASDSNAMTKPSNDGIGKVKNSMAVIAVGTACSGVLVVICGICLFLLCRRKGKHSFFCCGCNSSDQAEGRLMHQGSSCATSMSGPTRKPSYELIRTQAFRLTELKDATNGFKEVNELGRGTYGSVYKAILPDGRKVAVKRANAARRIHCKSRDFEAELEVLCKVRHAQLVNLVGYCEEMGERILVYEFMSNGTLHDHLHGGLTQLSWAMRFRIAVHAARGIEYLHRDATPRIIHKDIKSSNILLDSDWNARVADFGLSHFTNQVGDMKEELPRSPIHHFEVGPYTDPVLAKTQVFTEKSDVYSFGVVLLELVSGRRAYDNEYSPPSINEWARQAVQEGKTKTLLDPALELPKHVEPLLRMAEIAELCVRPLPDERPSTTDIVLWLELVGRGSFV
ncbi:hypothetical protein KC19_7G131500 [Ceratodon purpureus]|uniref:non-specific serine/threonine protein kinase n=1 Tax=Ceratodon purpureus TaxID=3225 RepID=A0A8T0HB37_CERPU|nr:hypothetical protein KC19_7G131500 [Ceratodon purpureus]KAG0567389.1 hypothetical protein KC19_7G131500 [Ceratodon purpureus]KAG0567390.1 hypothetical protein KC19_7G131500 [Ceratodon purpureus]